MRYFLLVLLLVFPLLSLAQVKPAGEIIVVKDICEEWYFPAWLGNSPYSPVFKVMDTSNKYGRYAEHVKIITLKDLIKFHGHFCGGLVESASALRVAMDLMFQDQPIDRTDLRIISNNSACGGDVAAYLTGGRSRFNSHLIDNALKESEFYILQVSTGRTVHVRLNPEVYPQDVKDQMKKLESGKFMASDIDLFQELQWAYGRRLINKPLESSFLAEEIDDYQLPDKPCRDFGVRKDNDFKNEPKALANPFLAAVPAR